MFLPWHALSVSLPSRLKILWVFDGAERRVSIQHCRVGTECGGLGVSLEQYFHLIKAKPVSSTAVGRGIIIMTIIPEYFSLTMRGVSRRFQMSKPKTGDQKPWGTAIKSPASRKRGIIKPSILLGAFSRSIALSYSASSRASLLGNPRLLPPILSLARIPILVTLQLWCHLDVAIARPRRLYLNDMVQFQRRYHHHPHHLGLSAGLLSCSHAHDSK